MFFSVAGRCWRQESPPSTKRSRPSPSKWPSPPRASPRCRRPRRCAPPSACLSSPGIAGGGGGVEMQSMWPGRPNNGQYAAPIGRASRGFWCQHLIYCATTRPEHVSAKIRADARWEMRGDPNYLRNHLDKIYVVYTASTENRCDGNRRLFLRTFQVAPIRYSSLPPCASGIGRRSRPQAGSSRILPGPVLAALTRSGSRVRQTWGGGT